MWDNIVHFESSCFKFVRGFKKYNSKTSKVFYQFYERFYRQKKVSLI